MPRLRLKICGVATLEEAATAVSAGADAIGLDPSAFPSSGMAASATLAAVSLAIPPAVTAVLLTKALTAGTIAQQVDAAAVAAVQIVRPLPASEYPGLKRIIRGRRLIQSIRVGEPGALDEARACAGYADALHLAADHADQTSICRQITKACRLPVFLHLAAPDPSAAMIREIRPFAIDLDAPRRDGTLDVEALGRIAAWLDQMG